MTTSTSYPLKNFFFYYLFKNKTIYNNVTQYSNVCFKTVDCRFKIRMVWFLKSSLIGS